jgi:hypothetical protein
MPIDASIALGIKPVQTKSQNEYLNELYTMRNAEQANQMNQMKMAETERAQAQAEDTRNFFRTPGLNIENMTPTQKQTLASKDPALFEKLMTQQSTQKTQESETAKRAVETRGIYADHYGNEFSKLTNPQEAASLVSSMYDNVHMKDSPIHGVTKKQALARIPQDVNSPEWLKYIQQNSLNAKDYGQSQLLEFRDTGDATQGFDKTSGLARGPSTAKGMTPKEQLDAFPGLQEAQASRKQLVEDIKQGAINMQNTASSPELAYVFRTQQVARSEQLAKLDKDIIGMKTKANETTRAPSPDMQLVNELTYLDANGLGKSPRATHVRALLAKQEHIAETESYTPEGLNLAADMVRNGVVPPRGGKGAINAAAAAGVTAKDFVTGKANIAGLTQVTKTEAQTGAFENTFVKNAEATLQMGRRIGKSGVPIIDEYLANPAARASGKNPELAAYDVFIKGTLNEYAKIVSGALGNTAVAQNEIKKMEKLLNSAQTTEQLENAVNAMITETRNRRWGFKAQKAEILGQPEPAAPVNKFNLETKEVMVNGKKIKAVKGEDGKWYPK